MQGAALCRVLCLGWTSAWGTGQESRSQRKVRGCVRVCPVPDPKGLNPAYQLGPTISTSTSEDLRQMGVHLCCSPRIPGLGRPDWSERQGQSSRPVQVPEARLLALRALPTPGFGLSQGWPRPQAHRRGRGRGSGRECPVLRPDGGCRGSPAGCGACRNASGFCNLPRQGKAQGPLGGRHAKPGEQYG